MKISVVIPFYNTRDCIVPLYQRLGKVIQQLGVAHEIICVDDCSPQKDWEVIKQLSLMDENVKLIKLTRNFGQQAAITAGIDHATGEWVVVMDGDLQDKPEEIPSLYEKALTGYDIVYARRAKRKDSILKRIYSWLFHKAFSFLTGIQMDETIGNFGIYSRKVIDAFLSMRERFRGFGLLIAWMRFNSTSITVDHQERVIGKTSYNFVKGLRLALDAFTAFSDKPLKITALFGLGLSALAFAIGVIYLIRGILGLNSIIGWTSLIISVWFLGGILILLIGVIGLYMGKVFDETKKRPHYIVEFTSNLSKRI